MSAAFDVPSSLPTQYDPDRQWKIDHAGKIDKPTAKILILVLGSIAVVSSILRLAFRLHINRRVFAHDILVIFATLTFIPMTVVLFQLLPRMYVVETVNSDPSVVFMLPELIELLDTPKWVFSFFALGWTSIFSIKLSFLVFFRPLIRNLSRWLEIYYWFGVVLTGLSWIFLVVEPAILCPHVGIAAIKCFPNTDYELNLGMSAMVIALDILTDLIIISLPATILSMSKMRLSQKLGIAVFLCLSVAMVIISIIRLAGGLHQSARGRREFSMVWTHLLLHVEASVAVLMGSVSAFRTIFVSQPSGNNSTQGSSLYRRFLHKIGLSSGSRRSTEESGLVENAHGGLPEKPHKSGVTMHTLRNFIRRHNRQPGATTLGSVGDSVNDHDEDYHQYMKKEAQPLKINVSREWSSTQSPVQTSTVVSGGSVVPLSLISKDSGSRP